MVTGQLAFNLHRILVTGFGQGVLHRTRHLWPYLLRFSGVSIYVVPPYLTRDVMQRGIEDFQKATWPATYGGLTSILTVGLAQRLHEIDKPTLIIAGSRDEVVPASDARLAASLISGAQLLEIADCHHHVADEYPELFQSTISGFLSGKRSEQSP